MFTNFNSGLDSDEEDNKLEIEDIDDLYIDLDDLDLNDSEVNLNELSDNNQTLNNREDFSFYDE